MALRNQKKTQLDNRLNVLKSLAGMVFCETHAQQMQQTHDAIRAAVKVTMRIPNVKQDRNKHKRKSITRPVTTTAAHRIVSQQNSSDSSVVRVPLDDAPTLQLQGHAPTQRASNEQMSSKSTRPTPHVATRRTAAGGVSLLAVLPSCCFRLKTSSINRLGPMYSKLAILKDELRSSGICMCVVCFEWKRRLMQSSTSAIRPVATTTLVYQY